MTPDSPFRCEFYRCTLSARACVLRQRAKIKNSHGREIKTTSITSHCITGDCDQGKLIKLSLVGQKIEPCKKINLAAYWKARREAQAKSIKAAFEEMG